MLKGGVKSLFTMLLATSFGMPGQMQAQTANRTVPAPLPAAAPAANGRLFYCRQAPDTGNPGYSAGNLSLCPNPVNLMGSPVGVVSGQPYIFDLKSKCRGNVYNGSRPAYRYTLKYRTVGGGTYTEEWQDTDQWPASGTSRVQFFLFDRVPHYVNSMSASGLNSRTSTGSTNATFVPWPTTYNQTAVPGEIIESLCIEGRGYNCGLSGGDDSGDIDIAYYTLAPKPIVASPQATAYCRNIAYTLTTPGALGASSYQWTATNGAQIINGTGSNNQVLLNLNNVPPTATTVTVSVQALNAPGTCGGPTSTATTLVLPMSAASPQPSGLKLSGGSCPSATIDKAVSVPLTGIPGVFYRWKLLGPVPAGTFLTVGAPGPSAGTPVQTTGVLEGNTIALRAPTAGAVTVSAEAIYDGCSGISTPLVQTFQISAPVPQMPRAIGPAIWCVDMPNRVQMAGTTGATYSRAAFGPTLAYNIVPAGATVTSVTQPTVGSAIFDIVLGPNAAGSYPTSFDLQIVANSPCTGVATQYFTVPVNSAIQQQCVIVAPGGNRLAPPINLYPNPTTGQVQLVHLGTARYAWAKVTDTQGRAVWQQTDESAAGLTYLDLKALPAGLYQVQLFDGKQLTSQRLVKE